MAGAGAGPLCCPGVLVGTNLMSALATALANGLRVSRVVLLPLDVQASGLPADLHSATRVTQRCGAREMSGEPTR